MKNMELDIDEISNSSPLKTYSSEVASQGMYSYYVYNNSSHKN